VPRLDSAKRAGHAITHRESGGDGPRRVSRGLRGRLAALAIRNPQPRGHPRRAVGPGPRLPLGGTRPPARQPVLPDSAGRLRAGGRGREAGRSAPERRRGRHRDHEDRRPRGRRAHGSAGPRSLSPAPRGVDASGGWPLRHRRCSRASELARRPRRGLRRARGGGDGGRGGATGRPRERGLASREAARPPDHGGGRPVPRARAGPRPALGRPGGRRARHRVPRSWPSSTSRPPREGPSPCTGSAWARTTG